MKQSTKNKIFALAVVLFMVGAAFVTAIAVFYEGWTN
jgi:hypothetical protein